MQMGVSPPAGVMMMHNGPPMVGHLMPSPPHQMNAHQMGQMGPAPGFVAVPHLQIPPALPPRPEYAVAHYFCASPCGSPAGVLNKGPSPAHAPQLHMLPPHMT